MTFSLVLPQLSSKNNSTKEKIVSVLSVKWPLTTKEIFFSLKNEFGFDGSYQAVHKVIKELQEEGVLSKTHKGIMLDRNWINNLTNFTKSLQQSYSKKKLESREIEDTIHLTFNSFMDFAKFLVNKYYANTEFNPEKKDGVCFWNHVYPVTGVGKEEYRNLKEFLKYSNHYAISRNNTVADDFFGKYITKLGKKCFNGIDFSVKNDTFVHGDHILEVFFSPKMSEQMGKIYSEVKEINEIELQKFFDFVVNTDFKIEAVIYKNKTLAQKLTEEAAKIYEMGVK